MKKLLLLLFTTISFAQTNFNFYYGSNESLGAEILINESAGFGFAGTLEKSEALGVFSPGNITDWDKQNFISTTTQKWFTMYAVTQLKWFGQFQVSCDYGIAMYGRHANFLDPNRNQYYHKKDKLLFKPMIGLNVTYPITNNIGWQLGFDTFNHLNTGFVVYF